MLRDLDGLVAKGLQRHMDKALVVDDDRDAAESLAQLLVAYGYEARAVFSAADALALLDDFQPLCVLMDLSMPGLSGLDLARAIRVKYGYTFVLVAVTGHTRDEEHRAAEDAGIDFVLTKPLDVDLLRKVMQPRE